MKLNEDNVITRDYIHKQLGRNFIARSLENEFHIFAANNENIPEFNLVSAFLDFKGLPYIHYFTFDYPDVYLEDSLFYFTHAEYYEYTQLIRRNQERIDEINLFSVSHVNEVKQRVEMENRRLLEAFNRLVSDIRIDSRKLWREPALLFLYHHMLGSLSRQDLKAYKFVGVFNVVPYRICYLS